VFFFIVLGVAGGVPNVFPSSSQDVPIRFPKCFHTFHERISKEPTVQSEFICIGALVMVQSIESWGESSVSFSNILGLG